MELPTDYDRPALKSQAGSAVDFTIDASLSEVLQDFANRSDVTLYMVFLAAFTVLLAQYSGQNDVIVGTPIAGRRHADLEPLIGMFVNTLAIRSYPSSNKTFTDYLQEVKQHTIEAYEHQDYPFDMLVEQLNLKRDLSRSPLFDVMFVMQNTEEQVIEMESLVIKPFAQEHRTAKFDLTLTIGVKGNQLTGLVEYCRELFKAQTIQDVIDDLLSVLQQMVSDPEIKLSDITLRKSNVFDEDEFDFDDMF